NLDRLKIVAPAGDGNRAAINGRTPPRKELLDQPELSPLFGPHVEYAPLGHPLFRAGIAFDAVEPERRLGVKVFVDPVKRIRRSGQAVKTRAMSQDSLFGRPLVGDGIAHAQ